MMKNWGYNSSLRLGVAGTKGQAAKPRPALGRRFLSLPEIRGMDKNKEMRELNGLSEALSASSNKNLTDRWNNYCCID